MFWIICGILIAVIILIYLIFKNNDKKDFYFCNKLYITYHYDRAIDYVDIDLSNYKKDKIIRFNFYYRRCAKPGEQDGLTELAQNVIVYRIKGEDEWWYWQEL